MSETLFTIHIEDKNIKVRKKYAPPTRIVQLKKNEPRKKHLRKKQAQEELRNWQEED